MEFHTIKYVKPLKDMILEIVFNNGIKKKYDIKLLLKKNEVFKKLKDEKLFNEVKIDIGGYALIWNEKIDLSSEEIWNNGY